MFRLEIDEKSKTIDLWVRRKRGNRKLECSGCGRKLTDAYDSRERAVRDLPWSEFEATVHIEVYRVKCPECGVRIEKVPLLPSKAPFSKRFEDAVGQACESASARQVARRLDCPRAPSERSICGTWSDGMPSGGNRRYGRWASMRSTGTRKTSHQGLQQRGPRRPAPVQSGRCDAHGEGPNHG